MEPPYKPRQFVWCNFPFMEEPLRPGPEEHVAYVADIRRIDGNAHLTVMSIYTTTTPWEPDIKLPLGIIPVEPAMAQKMNQKTFVMDARKIAFIPVTRAFFPRLVKPDKGIINSATEHFHQLVQNTLMKLAKRPELVVKLGPDIPGQRNPK
jgi:hypothetical protein